MHLFLSPGLLTFPFRAGATAAAAAAPPLYNKLQLVNQDEEGSHEEALGFHGTLLRIDPALTGRQSTDQRPKRSTQNTPSGVHSKSGHETRGSLMVSWLFVMNKYNSIMSKV